jgi:predicted phage terminase large subunit-like protein
MKTQSITAASPIWKSENSKASLIKPQHDLIKLQHDLPRFQADVGRRFFYEFVKLAWHVLEPGTPFVDGFHVRAICDHLQAVTEGLIQNLIINIPPGHAKSLIVAVFWPAWVWIMLAEARWLFSSHREELALRDSVRCRRLIESPWYQTRWGNRFRLSDDQNQKGRFENTKTGYRVVVPMSAGTGERGDYVVVDDPHSVEQAESDTQRAAAIDWWNGSMATRLNDLSTGHKVVIMQRLHESDLTGDLLSKGGYEHLCLPAEFDPDRRCTTSIGWSDPRQEQGELLWPQKVSNFDLDNLKKTLGSYRYAAQYQQRPAPAEGGIFKRHWWRFYGPANTVVQVRIPDGSLQSIPNVPLPEEFDEVVQSWDLSFKDLATSDYVVGQVWGAKGADRYLLDQTRERMDLPRTLDAIRAMSAKWPNAAAKLVEDRANGPAVIASLKHELQGLIAVNPEGGKMVRASAVSPQIEAGNVYLPHPSVAPWVEDLIEESASFPNAKYDDQVDALTQALNRLRGGSCLVYTVPESDFTIDPQDFPSTYEHVFAMDVGPAGTAVLWLVSDRKGYTLCVRDVYYEKGSDPGIHAARIRSRGSWIPGLFDPTANGRSREDGLRLIQIYRDLGLDLNTAVDSEQSGVLEVTQCLTSGRLKVFRGLEQLFQQYRLYRRDQHGLVVKQNDSLMNCLRHVCVAGPGRMRSKPNPQQDPDGSGYQPGMENAWMR